MKPDDKAANDDVIGYDIEAHEYGDAKYPAKLVLQDVLTIHGSQFKDAALIVAKPALPGVLVSGHALEACEGAAAARQLAFRGLLPDSARGFRGGWPLHPPRCRERAWSSEVGRSVAMELRVVPPLGRRSGPHAHCHRIEEPGRLMVCHRLAWSDERGAIAKIPLPLARHIAATYKPRQQEAA